MNDPSHPSEASLPPTVVKQIDRVCDRFEEAWKAGQEPRIEDYLGLDPAIEQSGFRARLLVELVMVDLEHRWQSGTEDGAGQGGSATQLWAKPRQA